MKKIILASAISTLGFAHASDIILSKSIKAPLRDKIEKDMGVLADLKFKTTPSTSRTLKMMGLSSLTADSAESWLETRIKYIIEENAFSKAKLLLKRVIFIEKENVDFPHATTLPYSLAAENPDPSEEDQGFTVMSNVGAMLYLSGKQEEKLYGLKISRGLLKSSIKVLVESPRAGIIQIGEGLFNKRVTINNQNPDGAANSINRLGIFFHEARHSDGNGSSLTFNHAVCPKGHDLEGAHACDENLNGPYSIQAAMTLEMLKSCDDKCTEREKEILTLYVLDSENRVLKTTHKKTPATDWDSTPESL